MTGLWESIYEQLDNIDHRIYGADFYPSMGVDRFGKIYKTQIVIFIYYGYADIGTVEAY